MKPDRTLIKYLDMGDGLYIENDQVKVKPDVASSEEYVTLDEM